MFDVEGQLGDVTRHSISDIKEYLKTLCNIAKARADEEAKLPKVQALTLPTSVTKIVNGSTCWYFAKYICTHDKYVTYEVTKKSKKDGGLMHTDTMTIDVKYSEVSNFLKNMGNYYENLNRIAMNGWEYKVIRVITHPNHNSFISKSECVTDIDFEVPPDWEYFTDFDPKKDCEDVVLDRVLSGDQTFVYVIKMWVTGDRSIDIDAIENLINAYINDPNRRDNI
jgi:hypothetical protein